MKKYKVEKLITAINKEYQINIDKNYPPIKSLIQQYSNGYILLSELIEWVLREHMNSLHQSDSNIR